MALIIVASLLMIACILGVNFYRAKINIQYKLRPNCLLTKHPLVFISGQKTLFYWLRYWNHLPQFLANHGFEVIELNLPWRDMPQRISALKDFFEREGLLRKFHFFSDTTLTEELHWILDNRSDQLESFNVLSTEESDSHFIGLSYPKSKPLFLRQLNPAPIPWSIKTVVFRAMISLHNLSLFPKAKLHPKVVAIPGIVQAVSVANLVLDIVIQLAERDLVLVFSDMQPDKQPNEQANG